MAGPRKEEDRFLEERKFETSPSIDLGDLIEEAKEAISPTNKMILPEKIEKEEDDSAIGDFFDPFASDDGIGPGKIMKDGSVPIAPDSDFVSDLATQGEVRLSWGLMAAMISVYSAISILVGTVVPDPQYAFFGLLILAIFGFVLGERWIPRPAMYQLGVVWLIIAMKILYGLAIELHSWSLFGIFPLDDTGLGISLLLLVVLNIFVAYRYNEDAIAAQAVLVLLAISSTVGSLGGELGVAGMILGATVLFHLLALHRQSGNLASLGIASSNLWIGMHALTPGFDLGSLKVLPLDTPMVLFLLLILTNSINAAMASRFSSSENWFSSGLNAVGLGKPALWSVSVGLGMIGALMAIAANRDDSSYALAMVTGLLTVFSGSYLTVRGVNPKRIIGLNGVGLILLLFVLILLDSSRFSLSSSIDAYAIFTFGAALIAAWLLIANQENVSDRVLWTGAVVVVILLTVLLPAKSSESGGDGGALLSLCISVLMAGSAYLAVRRKSPSLVGIVSLLPWTWVIAVKILSSSFDALVITNDIDATSPIILESLPIVVMLSFCSILQLIVNLDSPDGGINLAERFMGTQDISARLRDSGLMKVWNLGFVLGIISILFVSQSSGMTGTLLLILLASFLGIHIGSEFADRHQGNPRFLLILSGVTSYVLMWRHGMFEYFVPLITGLTLILGFGRRGKGGEDGIHIVNMSILTFAVLIWGSSSSRIPISPLVGPVDLSFDLTTFVILFCVIATISIYIPRISKLENILRPAISALILLVATMISLLIASQDPFSLPIAGLLFVISTIMIAINGEIRSELQQVARRDEQLRTILQSQQMLVNSTDVSESSPNSETRLLGFSSEEEASFAQTLEPVERSAIASTISDSGMKMINPKLVELQEKQRRRSKTTDTSGELDLFIGDIHHRPIVVLSFIGVMLIGGIGISLFSSTFTSIALVLIGTQSMILISISRSRAKTHNLNLPDILGVETPIALTMVGLSVIAGLGSNGVGASLNFQTPLMIVGVMNTLLAVLSLFGRSDIAKRLPSILELLIVTLLVSRLLGIPLNSTPMLLQVNPFAEGSNLIGWVLVWIVLEFLLLSVAMIWDWIEGRRRSLQLPDHRSASGRATWAAMITMLSFGPAGLLASMIGLRRGIQWTQPAAVTGTILSFSASLFAFTAWVPDFSEYYHWTIMSIGIICLLGLIWSHSEEKRIWTSTFTINAHILLVLAVLISPFPPVTLLATLLLLSTCTWVVGILQLRKGMRFWGASDLVFAAMAGVLTMGGDLLEPTTAFVALVALAIELGIVVWLAQKHQEAMLTSE
ncbi:MAG: hypothetical protein CMA29_03425 [Euryarchaeota archaeon]|nr:hypothetical protein [Euryarchaeota archaeon]|tara:strand:+ start:9912 stop:13829 length:3918 start_codon:yes stop_codon:yes gene_type:complete